jgi:hypothetical protein
MCALFISLLYIVLTKEGNENLSEVFQHFNIVSRLFHRCTDNIFYILTFSIFHVPKSDIPFDKQGD